MTVPETLVAGRYRLDRVIATGGMGVVWEGFDERLQRRVAVKLLHTLSGVPEAEAQLAKDRAMREARITARLHHPHAVTVFDVVEHEGRPCLVMELIPSTPLSARLKELGPLPVATVARVGHEVATALAAAHDLGIVHRDVKPGNILLTADGASHISDFGISHALGDATLTRTGLLHGTPAYLAPEAARGEEASYPADVFSLGSTLFAALEGAPPFGSDENSIALLHKVAAADVPAPTNAGPLTGFLLDMLSPDPAARPTMREVADRLARLPEEEDLDRAMPPVAPTAVLPRHDEHGERDDVLPWFPPDPDDGDAHDGPGAPGSSGASGAPSGAADREPRRRGRALLLLGAAAVAVAVLVAALTGNLPGGSDAGEARDTSPSTAPSTSATSDTPSRSTTPSPTASSPSQTPTSRPTPSTSSPSASPPASRPQQLSSAISSYYALLPDDTDAAWSRLTAGYQRSPSGGRDSFESFWGRIDDVRVSDVRARPPDEVEATLRYTYENGRVDVERTRFRLVDEDGVLKIAGSEVLSSGPG
ncbi:hypothetical protein GCM10011314_05510 [Knoellia flava]|uniref:non-specific serine/threonine protein kinase n=1 Tax=Knoellia flava TaxID=913969 RepID=A0A8H9FQ02_9MICO|nr:hypothetical protein GCM10011314_05510 [Knoellia flava]